MFPVPLWPQTGKSAIIFGCVFFSKRNNLKKLTLKTKHNIMNVLSFLILRALEFSVCTLFKKLYWFILPIILFIFAEHYDFFISYFNLQEWWANQLKYQNSIYILISFEFIIGFVARVLFTQIALNLTIENSKNNYRVFIPRFMVFLKFIIASLIYL